MAKKCWRLCSYCLTAYLHPPAGQDLGLNSILYTVAENTDHTPLLRVLLKLLDDKQRADEMMKKYGKK